MDLKRDANPRRYCVPAIVCLFSIFILLAPLRAADTISTTEVRALVRQLGDRSYDKRREAQRRLCALGPGAVEALQAAAKDANPEVAIRAREIVHTLSQLLFSGVKITLTGPTKPVDWDEPFTVVLEMENTSTHPARVPIFPEARDPARDSPTALQAARMIDWGDYLTVTGPDDKPIAMHVDDMMELPMLGDAVNLRLTDDAVTTLAPGERRRVVLDTFSRGWARYRMLEKGRYRIQLTYVPAWDDEELRRRRVGRVESNALAVHVRKAAPATVRRDGRKIMAELSRKDDRLVVELVGTGDLPVHVNTAIGPRLSRTATVVWGVWWKDQSVEFQHPEATTPDKPFTEVAAGDRVTVASLPIDAVFAHKALEAIPADETVTLVARYTSVLSRSFVLGGPPGSRKKILPRGTTAAEYATTLPLTLYSGSPPTNKLEITRPR